jgi:predicted membrane protein
MSENPGGFFNMRLIIGVVIVIVGALALFMNLGFQIDISIWDYWPLILILFGLSRLLQPREYRSTLSGLIFLVLGVFLLLNNLKVTNFGFSELWPILLILIGIAIIRQGYGTPGGNTRDTEYINLNAILGGGEYNYSSKSLKGGSVAAFMGGVKIDLRQADTQEEPMVIDAFSIMGGIEIVVPRNWEITVTGTPILGGMENKTTFESSPDGVSRKLLIKGTTIMGGVEIKN